MALHRALTTEACWEWRHSSAAVNKKKKKEERREGLEGEWKMPWSLHRPPEPSVEIQTHTQRAVRRRGQRSAWVGGAEWKVFDKELLCERASERASERETLVHFSLQTNFNKAYTWTNQQPLSCSSFSIQQGLQQWFRALYSTNQYLQPDI